MCKIIKVLYNYYASSDYMKYQAKVYTWIRVILYIILLIFFTLIFFVPKAEILVIIIITFSLAIIIFPFLYRYYELTDEYLYIHKSIFTKKILFINIKSFILCKNFKSRYPMKMKESKLKNTKKELLKGLLTLDRKTEILCTVN